jgi:hypothetical protein
MSPSITVLICVALCESHELSRTFKKTSDGKTVYFTANEFAHEALNEIINYLECPDAVAERALF